MPAIWSGAGGVLIRVRVQPRSSREEVAGRMGDSIRVRITAPPVDGAANDALVRFLASRLLVPRSAIELKSGQTGRTKVVSVTGVTEQEAADRLLGDS
jgi:uncharacterized protein